MLCLLYIAQRNFFDILKADIQPVIDNNESAIMGNWYANVFYKKQQ